MAKIELPVDGGCRCGGVRVRITAPPLLAMACHCRGCQKMSASAYSLSAAIPAAGFAVTQGEPVLGGMRGPQAHHYHCPDCMSWLFTRAEGIDWAVNMRPTMLDDARWFAPFVETFTSERLPWAVTGAAHSFPQFPGAEDYGALIRDYAA